MAARLLRFGLALAALSGCSEAAVAEAPSTDGGLDVEPAPIEIGVMTFNVRNSLLDTGQQAWSKRKPLAIALIEEQAPDVIGTQELLLAQREDLLDGLGGYEAFGTSRTEFPTDEQSAIFSRSARIERLDGGSFWLSETPDAVGSVGWDAMFPRVCTWARLAIEGGASVYFYNTHLDHLGAKARDEGAKLITEHIAERDPPGPVVFTGDFNATPGSPPVAAVEDAGLVDAYASLHPKVTDGATFHAYAGGTGGTRIDYVFVSSSIDVLDVEILHDSSGGTYPSDHYPVMARLRLPSR